MLKQRPSLILVIITCLLLATCEMPVASQKTRVGLHVHENDDREYRFFESPTPELIKEQFSALDWQTGYHQLKLIQPEGVSMEVGGSLAKGEQLAAVFQDKKRDIYLVAKPAPQSINDLQAALLSFQASDGRWRQLHSYQ